MCETPLLLLLLLLMCRTRRDTLVSHPRPTARSTPTRRYSNTNSSSFLPNQTSSSSSSSSNAISTTTTSSSTAATSLTNLHLSLSDNATLYPFSEISTSTRNFRSKPLPSSSSWSCTLRGKQVVILQLPFRGDPASLSSRLSALCKCHHSSLVKLVGASLGGDYIYPVYEFVSGATLRECLRNPRNPDFTTLSKWISRIQIAADLADGLEYIHIHCRTIHNRIKSSTVIVTEPSFNAKICHFGAADLAGEIPDEVVEKIAEEEEEGEGKDEISVVEDEISVVRRSNSRRMKIDGTRGYMAPEVIAGGRISQKSDVFAFGVVILELVSGKEPLKYRTSREAGSEYERVSLIETARDAIGTEDEDGASEMEAEARRWRVRQWVDRRLRDSFPVEVAEKLILVALRCVEEERFMRPEITLVAGMVSKLFLESKVWDERVRLPTDFSVTIGPR